jgi:hypothetical protein
MLCARVSQKDVLFRPLETFSSVLKQMKNESVDETWFKAEDEEENAGTPPDESSLAHADGHKTAGGRRDTQAERKDEKTGCVDAHARLSTTSLARLLRETISGLDSLCAEGDGKIRLLSRIFVWDFVPLYFRGRRQTVLQGLHSFVIHSLPFEELRLAVNMYCTGSGFSNNKVLNS